MSTSGIPDYRCYRHQLCSAETVVSGQSFQALSDPLSDMSRTWCNTCNGFFPLSDYQWSDTDEKITDYYARHSARASGIERFLCSRVFLLIVAVLGLLLGVGLAIFGFRGQGWGMMLFMALSLGVIGVIVLASLKEFFLAPLIVRRICGVRDTRLLK